ncbi:unnamed protein product [Phytophthora fragariaefolia]|uniref:Unnamed protein product n=1 Tax=Phytophthora fragariaefolia TaxID=1490495 RepID=A0A9W6Y940_9STRA|nr:unnamed protein product [Phytophthora fragariaefolia]
MGPKPVDSITIGAMFHQHFLHSTPGDLLNLTTLVEDGKVKPIIDSIHPSENVLHQLMLNLRWKPPAATASIQNHELPAGFDSFAPLVLRLTTATSHFEI